MAKWCSDAFLDQSLNWVKNNITRMSVCDAQPTTHAEANTTYALAYTVMASGDFTVGNGDTNGRKIAVAQKANIAVGSTGTATHIALFAYPGTYFCYVTTCATQLLTSGNTVTIPTWDIEIRDPA